MSTKYVDNLLVGTTTTYDPITRSSTGGSSTAYSNITVATAALAGSDILYCRTGSAGTLSASAQITLSVANLTISPYPIPNSNPVSYEDAWVLVTATTGNIIVPANSTLTWSLKIKGNGVAMSGRCLEFSGTTGGTYDIQIEDINGYSIGLTGTTAMTFNKVNIKRSGAIRANQTGTCNFNNPVFEDCYSDTQEPCIFNAGASAVTVYNNPVIVGGGNLAARAMAQCDNGTLTLNNPTLIGNGMKGQNYISPSVSRTAGTCTINGGIVNGNINDPRGKLTSGTITSTAQNNVFTTAGSVAKKVGAAACYLTDSNHSVLFGGVTSLTEYSSQFGASNAPLTWLLDDMDELDATSINNGNAFKNSGGGNEIGIQKISSTSTNIGYFPWSIRYSGTNPQVALVVDAVGISVYKDFNTTPVLVGTRPFASSIFCGNILGGNTTYQYMDYWLTTTSPGLGSVDGTFLEITPNNGVFASYGGNMFDDVPSGAFTPGTYILTSTYTPQPLTWATWMNLDVLPAYNICFTNFGVYPTSYSGYFGSTESTETINYVKSLGIKNGITGQVVTGSTSTNTVPCIPTFDYMLLSPYRDEGKIKNGNSEAAYSGIGAAAQELRVRQFVRCICSAYASKTGIFLLELPRKAAVDDIFTATEVGWLVSEFAACGMPLKTVQGAADFMRNALSSGSSSSGMLSSRVIN